MKMWWHWLVWIGIIAVGYLFLAGQFNLPT